MKGTQGSLQVTLFVVYYTSYHVQINPFPAVDKYICLPQFVFGARLFHCIVVYCCCGAGTPPTFDYSACALSIYLKIYMYIHVHEHDVHENFIFSIWSLRYCPLYTTTYPIPQMAPLYHQEVYFEIYE